LPLSNISQRTDCQLFNHIEISSGLYYKPPMMRILIAYTEAKALLNVMKRKNIACCSPVRQYENNKINFPAYYWKHI
jgi:hypothetical protein